MFDLIIAGGTAVLPSGAEPADIGVSGGKIAAIGGAGSLAAISAGRVVDAAGQIVMPGGVDPHIHCSSPIPFPGRNEDLLSAPPEQVSRAALYGGTTTLLDFAPCPADQPLQQSIELRKREWAGTCYCDYGFHLLLYGKLSQGVLGPLPEAIQEGHASVKMFTTDIRPNRSGRMVQFGDIWEVLKILGASGGVAAIHAEDNDIVMHMYEKLIREDRTGFENMAEVHNTLSEDLSFNRVIRLAENVEGAALTWCMSRLRLEWPRLRARGRAVIRSTAKPCTNTCSTLRKTISGRAARCSILTHRSNSQRIKRRCGQLPTTARSRRLRPTRFAVR